MSDTLHTRCCGHLGVLHQIKGGAWRWDTGRTASCAQLESGAHDWPASSGWAHGSHVRLVREASILETEVSARKALGIMKDARSRRWFQVAVVLCLSIVSAAPLFSAMKNWAVVTASGNKLRDVPLSDLSKLCKGAQKLWTDGKPFTLVIHDPDSPDMRYAIQKLFGGEASELKPVFAKINEGRKVIRIVDTDQELLRTVEATPGAVGLVDVYSINSSVKVLRVDGKLPFDPGYPLKGN